MKICSWLALTPAARLACGPSTLRADRLGERGEEPLPPSCLLGRGHCRHLSRSLLQYGARADRRRRGAKEEGRTRGGGAGIALGILVIPVLMPRQCMPGCVMIMSWRVTLGRTSALPKTCGRIRCACTSGHLPFWRRGFWSACGSHHSCLNAMSAFSFPPAAIRRRRSAAIYMLIVFGTGCGAVVCHSADRRHFCVFDITSRRLAQGNCRAFRTSLARRCSLPCPGQGTTRRGRDGRCRDHAAVPASALGGVRRRAGAGF